MTMTTMDAAFIQTDQGSGPREPMEGNRYVLPGHDGQPVTWNGATTLAAELDNPYALSHWQMRQVALGMGRRPDLVALAGATTADDKVTLRGVVKDALAAAGTDAGANHGTALHKVFERVDTGTPLSELPEYFHADVHARAQELARHGLIMLPEFRERVIRCEIYSCAGRLDGIARMSDGSLVLVDDKSEKDPEKYPHAKAVQLGIYANAGELMDYSTNSVVPMPPVRKDFALIIHTRPGSGECRIFRVDIARGWAAARIAVELREWRKAGGLVAPYISEGSWAPPSPVALPSAPPAAATSNGHVSTCSASQPSQAPTNEQVAADVDAGLYGGPPAAELPAEAPTQQQPATDPTVPVVDPVARVTEILDIRKNDKSRLQVWAKALGCTDIAHHRKWLAEWIVAATPGSGATEPGDAHAPRTPAATGLPQAPMQPPGEAVVTAPLAATVDLSQEAVAQRINAAKSKTDLRDLWQAYTDAYGVESWSGWVLERANSKAIELSRKPAAANPFL